MQIKGIIKWLVLILGLACIWQLSFTFVTRKIEAEAEAQPNPKAYLDAKWDEKVFMGYTYGECKSKELNLGLDLKGGMNVTLEIQAADAVRVHALENIDKSDVELVANIEAAINAAKKETSDADVIATYLDKLTSKDLKAIYETDDKSEITDNLESYIESSVENMDRVLRERIDLLGVIQPNIQRINDTNRILVELPGVDDPESAAKLLASTASLEFWEVCEASTIYELYNFFYNGEADACVLTALAESEEVEATEVVEETEAAEATEETEAAEVEVVKEENLRPFSSLLVAEYPFKDREGKTQTGRVGGHVFAAASKENMAKINEYLALEEVQAKLEDLTNGEVLIAWSNKNTLDGTRGGIFTLYALQGNGGLVPAMDGSGIVEAKANSGQFGGFEVSMTMNSKAAAMWGDLTEKNIGKPLAIVMDNVVYSAPNVNDRIDGGRSSITGGFTAQEAEDLANVLNSGKVPAPATIISQEVVGPSLGADSIMAGLISFAIAFVLVLIYMAFFYKTAGLFANIALLFNVLLLMGVLVSTGAVLTLPGIAGIVLTMGMAVDANVIIFERVKEELRGGKGLMLAIKDGFKNAYSAIIDGNLTTIITGAVLFFFGTGPVKGFATTLVLGIITSLFCSIFVTRVLLEGRAERRGTCSFSTKFSENFLQNVKFSFIGKRKYSYIISGVLILASIISIVVRENSFNLGIDFTGGRHYVVKFDQNVSEDDVRDAIEVAFKGESAANKSVDVARIGNVAENTFRIKTQFEPTVPVLDDTATPEQIANNNANYILEETLYNALKGLYANQEMELNDFRTITEEHPYGIESSQQVGSSISGEMTRNSIIAVVISLLAIGIYIAIRFRRWQWALGATAALAHNAFLVIGIFSMLYSVMPFAMEVNQAFIAAILTIIGYSINDTVVIFDRIREYNGLDPKRDIKTNIDNAICATLSRTVNTSMTTLVTLLAIFFFGGETIRGFVFALILGVVIGTYSSVFIATPIAYDCQRKKAAKLAAAEEK